MASQSNNFKEPLKQQMNSLCDRFFSTYMHFSALILSKGKLRMRKLLPVGTLNIAVGIETYLNFSSN